MKQFQVIIDREPPYIMQAADSFSAWKYAIELHPDASRVEVKAERHALILDKSEGFQNAGVSR